MNRRNFLKLSGAVALVAALPALPSVPLAPRAYARHAIIRLRDGQVVEGCTFQRCVMFVGPAQNVLIRDCTFSGGDMVLGFDVTNTDPDEFRDVLVPLPHVELDGPRAIVEDIQERADALGATK